MPVVIKTKCEFDGCNTDPHLGYPDDESECTWLCLVTFWRAFVVVCTRMIARLRAEKMSSHLGNASDGKERLFTGQSRGKRVVLHLVAQSSVRSSVSLKSGETMCRRDCAGFSGPTTLLTGYGHEVMCCTPYGIS
jgi:hypothetical protein